MRRLDRTLVFVVAIVLAASGARTRAEQPASEPDLAKARAHWVSRDTIAWNVADPDWRVRLHVSPDATLALGAGGVAGGIDVPLALDQAGLSDAVKAAFPHLAAFRAYRIPADRLPEVPTWLRGQLAVSAVDASGALVDATALQIPGVLDDVFSYRGPLGPTFDRGVPTLRVWAPTARSVALRLFADGRATTSQASVPMKEDPATGVWSVTGRADWKDQYYLYDVEVFTRATNRVEHNLVTDPYSLSVSTNGLRSQIVDLADASLKPPGWDRLAKPRLDAPEDIVLYELHVRDASASDSSVPPPLRGTFEAFTLRRSNGMRHLAALARAGLTHVHLLPSFDIASVDEDRSHWQSAAGNLASYPPDSPKQQAAVVAAANADGYNWGYDPLHYTVPEGSYATNPEGPTRVREFRDMVAGLSSIGLRVVMDVVYNHTSAAGQSPGSVLDRIVPGYYHRLDANGDVATSTCCANTATEHAMMEKLLVDSVVTWAKAYKVDGFRFDLMGHHMKRNMLALRRALDGLTLAADGVDGSKIYLYGEGWNFGEVADDARGVNATQRNMAGTGIGTFNDRLRDAARGGGPFSGLQEQGFVTGLFTDPNATTPGSAEEQKARLLMETAWIRLGLAGNLAGFRLGDRLGRDVDYKGQPAAYTSDPQECVNYVDAHDNETLFDAIQLKAPVATPMAERVRMENLGLSLVLFGEGIPFVHAGSELLRSKSLDRNSFNSGDWFNRLDLTMATNNWGVGLPPAPENEANWPVMAPLLANPSLRPTRADIVRCFDVFREMLAIRKSSALFRLRTAAEIEKRLTFIDTGKQPGLIVMMLSDDDGAIDRRYARIVVAFNASDEAQTIDAPELVGHGLRLHPIQAASVDAVVRHSSFDARTGALAVPARTAAVFVERR